MTTTIPTLQSASLHFREGIPGLSVPLTGAMDLVEGNFTPVDFKSAAAKPDAANAAFDHEIQLVSYQLLMEAATGEKPPSLDLVFLVKTKTPQVIRVKSPPADAHRIHLMGDCSPAVKQARIRSYMYLNSRLVRRAGCGPV